MLYERQFLIITSFFSVGGKTVSTDTLYVIIAGISGVTVLLLVVVSTLLIRSRRSSTTSPHNKKGYMPTATSPGGKTGTLNKNKGVGREIKPPDLWIHHQDQIELKGIKDETDSNLMTPIARTSNDMNTTLDVEIERTKNLYDDIQKGATSPNGSSSVSIVSGSSTTRRGGRGGMGSSDHSSHVTSTNFEPSTGLSRPLYPRTHQFNIPRAHVTLDDGPHLGSPSVRISHAPPIGHHHNHGHHLYDPVSGPNQLIGIANAAVSGTAQISTNASYGTTAIIQTDVSSPNNLAKRSSAHPLKSFSVPSPPIHPSLGNSMNMGGLMNPTRAVGRYKHPL